MGSEVEFGKNLTWARAQAGERRRDDATRDNIAENLDPWSDRPWAATMETWKLGRCEKSRFKMNDRPPVLCVGGDVPEIMDASAGESVDDGAVQSFRVHLHDTTVSNERKHYVVLAILMKC